MKTNSMDLAHDSLEQVSRTSFPERDIATGIQGVGYALLSIAEALYEIADAMKTR